jgi:hypothetical protein
VWYLLVYGAITIETDNVFKSLIALRHEKFPANVPQRQLLEARILKNKETFKDLSFIYELLEYSVNFSQQTFVTLYSCILPRYNF